MRSQEEITHLAARWLARQYGDRIVVTFHDLKSAETQQDHPEVVGAIARGRLPLPVVSVDDYLTPLPFLSYWAIVDVVESVLSQQRQAV